MAGTVIMMRSAWVASFSSPEKLADTMREGYFGEHLDAVIAALQEASQVSNGSANLNHLIKAYYHVNPDRRSNIVELLAIHLAVNAKMLAPIVARAGDTFLGTRRFEDSKELSAKVAAALKPSDPVSAKADPKIREDFDKAMSDIRTAIDFFPLLPDDFTFHMEKGAGKALLRVENYAKTYPEFFEREHIELFRKSSSDIVKILGVNGLDVSIGILQILQLSRPDLFK